MNNSKIPNFRKDQFSFESHFVLNKESGLLDLTYHADTKKQNKQIKRTIKDQFKQILTKPCLGEFKHHMIRLSDHFILQYPVLFLDQFKHVSKKQRNQKRLISMIQEYQKHPDYIKLFPCSILSCFDTYLNETIFKVN